MNDIIFKLNIDESNKILMPVVEIYSGKIKTLRSKKFSGPLKPVDIEYINNAGNLSTEKKKTIYKIFHKDGNTAIAKNKHVLSESSFIALLNELAHNLCFYYTGRDRSLNVMEELLPDKFEMKITVQEKNKIDFNIFLLNEQQSIKVKKDAIVVGFKQSGLFFVKNKAYYVPNIVIGNTLNYILRYNLSLTRDKFQKIANSISQQGDEVVLIPVTNTIKDCYDVKPQATLYLSRVNGKINGELKFLYNAIELSYNEPGECIIDGQIRVFRNKSLEKSMDNYLRNNGWNKSFGANFVYQGHDLVEDIKKLTNHGVSVLSPAKKKIALPSNFKVNIAYNMNWFNISGEVTIENNAYDLGDVLKAAKNQQTWVEVDGRIIILPASLREKKSLFKQGMREEEGSYFVEKKHIGDLLELAGALNISRIKNIERLITYENIDLKIPQNLINTLRPYQLDGVKWLMYLYRNQFGGCLADDMGLGKTLQVIAFLSDKRVMGINNPSLIVVPKTLLFNWQKELNKFGSNLSYEVYHGKDRTESIKRMAMKKANILLTTYGTLLNDVELLQKQSFNLMILDEAQYIKNSLSKTYRAAFQIQARSKLALTGTPVENNIAELWALMNLLNPGAFGNRKKFIAKYSDLLSNKTTAQSLNERTRPFVLRRTKAQVLKELPEKIEQNILCKMEEEQSELYYQMLQAIRTEIKRLPGRFEMKSNSLILESLLYLRQICCHPLLLKKELNFNDCQTSAKFDVFKELVEELVNANYKVVVFSQFTSMLSIMEKWIKSQGWLYFYLDGKSINRQKIVEDFESAESGVFLISLKAGGLGLNLTSAQYAIIYDPWWNPAVENQAADRLYRIGQTKNVTVYKLVTANSIEEKIEELKTIKSEISDLVLDDTGNIYDITKEMLERLIFD